MRGKTTWEWAIDPGAAGTDDYAPLLDKEVTVVSFVAGL